MSKTCCVCQRSFEDGKTFVLTDEEKAAIGEDAPDELSYCSACLKVMETDREGGAQLLKGLYEMDLREKGFPANLARTMATRFYGKLINKKEKTH